MCASVCYICFDVIPSPKGASTHVSYFVQALAERYDVTLVSLGDTSEAMYCGARYLPVRLAYPNLLDRALAFREAVWDLLEEQTFDFVHFRTMWAALPVAEAKARQGLRAVCEVNAVESIELKYHYPALRGEPALLEKLRRQEDLAFATADAIVTPSATTRQYLVRRQTPEERITVIPNGVDLARFSPAPAHADGPLTLLYTGTLAPWQGLDLLLDGFRRAAAICPLRLRILGPGQSRWERALRKQIDKWGLTDLVELHPPVPHADMPAQIQAADICLAPLAPTERNVVQGCCPVKLFEYLACGKPIIASNLPVVREILTHEQDALLFNVRKPARLADCLLRLAEDAPLRQRLGENALRTAQEYSWRRAQERLLEVYAGQESSEP